MGCSTGRGSEDGARPRGVWARLGARHWVLCGILGGVSVMAPPLFDWRAGGDWYAHRTCLRKVAYPREAHAAQAARVVKRSRRVVLRVYQCPICRWWHVTSKAGE